MMKQLMMKAFRNNDPEQQTPINRLLPFVSLKILLVTLLFLGSLLSFIFLAYIATTGEEFALDNTISDYLSPLATPGTVAWMEKITFFGSSRFLFPAYAVLVAYFLLRKRIEIAINVAIVSFTAYALTNALKALLGRQRPHLPLIEALTTGSFPSGHSVSSFVFCMILVYLVSLLKIPRASKWALSVLLVLFSLLVGVSRLILKMHYPTDVVGGFCLGVVWVMLSFWTIQTMERKRRLSKK